MPDTNDLIKPMVSGEKSIVKSKILVNCLNYSAQKKFKIPKSFLESNKIFFSKSNKNR